MAMEDAGVIDFLELNTESDITLEEPDLNQLRHDRQERNRAVMQAVSPAMTAQVLHEQYQGSHPSTDPVIAAAICIQRWYRGFRGRKIYAEKLFEQFEKEEAAQHEKVLQQMEEGELLVENHQLEVLLDDNKTTRRNHEIYLRYSIITIQRAWRAYLERKQRERASRNQSSSKDNESEHQTRSESLEPIHTVSRSSNKGIVNINDVGISVEQVENETAYESDQIFQNPLDEIENNVVGTIQDQASTENFQQSEIQRLPHESDEDFNRRLKKHNYLQCAQRFAALKKIDSSVLPFDLHKYSDFSNKNNSNTNTSDLNCNLPPSESEIQKMAEIINQSQEYFPSVVNKADCDENDNTKVSCDVKGKHNDKHDSGIHCDGEYDSGINIDLSSSETGAKRNESSSNQVNTSNDISDTVASVNKREPTDSDKDLSNSDDCKVSSGQLKQTDAENQEDSKTSGEEIGPFDVYNIETALPDINWETLEESLKKASEEEKLRQEARRNDREEIRKKLAMGFDDDDDYDNDNDNDEEETSVYKKPNLQSRLQGGMNLQICFMNESPGDTDSDHGRSPRQFEETDNIKIAAKTLDIVDSDNNLPSVADLNRVKLDPNDRGEASNTTRLKSEDDEKDNQDFHSRQEKLQNEAKLALAQAGTMARMQLEIEKQTVKKSPMAEIVGIPGLGERRRKKLGLRKLQEMNLAQIQVLYNDLQTQIESLNEELVQLLMERDELHMEQDSMLVDVEDLTRRAEEIAEKATKPKPKETTTCNSKLKGKLLGR